MPSGSLKIFHAARFAVASSAARIVNAFASPGVDLVLWLQKKAQESRRIADGDATPARIRKRATSPLIWLIRAGAAAEIWFAVIAWRVDARATAFFVFLAAILVWFAFLAGRDSRRK